MSNISVFKLSFLVVLLSIVTSAWAQKEALYDPLKTSDRMPYGDHLPEFIKMMYQPNANFYAIEAAFERYEKAEKTKKNHQKAPENQDNEEVEDIYEVYFQRWKRAYRPYVKDDGSIVLPAISAYKRKIREENLINQKQAGARSLSSANWTNVGPKETFWLKNDDAAQNPCPWQVNIYSFDISKSNPNILFACAETGGVYKTTDKGLNWTACGSNSFNFGGSSEAVEIHPTNPDIVYVAVGAFLWRTIDGGVNWMDVASCTATGVHDIAILPSDPNVILVAADNGFFRSADGGTTWNAVYSQGCYDIEINPGNDSHVFILKANGTSVDFFKSTDAGVSFALKTTGISTHSWGRLAVTAADNNRIYALCTSNTNTVGPKLLMSTDEGETWTDMNPTYCTGGISDAAGGQGYYDLSIAASQTNANELLFGFCSTTKAVSVDGGSTFTFTQIGGYCGHFGIHPDLQEVKTIMNNGVMETWLSTDGGLTYSTDFFTNKTNASARNKGIYGSDFWGFAQGWNEDIMVGGRYHNGNTAMADFYPEGKALRLGGGEAATGYVFHGNERYTAFSDLGSVRLPATFGDQAIFGSYGKYPREFLGNYGYSNLAIHPYYFKHHYLGRDSSLWRSTDNGATFQTFKYFGSMVYRFEISRSNPSVMFVTTAAALYKTTDGGATWSTITLPSGKNPASLFLAIHPSNDQEVWISFINVSDAGRIYKTTDGGATWTNMDGTLPNEIKPKFITHTGGGIYVSFDGNNSLGHIFYRSVSATDWTNFSTNLPVSFYKLKMLPFYRDGKLRVAGDKGIWETPLESDVVPIALPTVDKQATNCSRDTFYFDDYSILKHAGATWTWSFSPAPLYVSNASSRQPKVVFGSAGVYSVTLTVANGAGSNTRTVVNMISVTSDGNCDPSTVIGKAMTSSTNGDRLVTPLINLNKSNGDPNNEITLMAWVKPSGAVSPYTSIVGTSGGTVELIVRDNNKLGIVWNGVLWGWESGHVLPANEWSHVAYVVTPTDLKLYLNGKEAINTTDPIALNLATTWIIGMDRDVSVRTFKGEIDEVCMYDRSLSINEIREKMHLIKTPSAETGLKGYFQFDETEGVVWNKVNPVSSSFSGNATRIISTAPVATGSSQRMSITTGGIKDFAAQNITLEFPGTGIYPNGDIVVNELSASPDQLPPGGTPLNTKYWIINNYGTNKVFTALSNIKFKNISTSSPASNFKLYQRSFNADGATWGTAMDGGDDLTANTLTFAPNVSCLGVMTSGQFTFNDDATTLPQANPDCVISPIAGRGQSNIANGDHVLTPPFNLNRNDGTNTDSITIMAWIRPNGIQNQWSGIVSCLSGAVVNLNFRDNNKLGIHWADAEYNWETGLTVPPNEWSHVALVVAGTSFKVYLNGNPATNANSTNPAPLNLANRQWYIGVDRGYSNRTFKGIIDEVCFYNRALSTQELREQMHLVKTAHPSLKAYFQYNESNATIWNKADNSFTTFSGIASRVRSTAPCGSGVSQTLTINSGGLKDYSVAGIKMYVNPSGSFPNGDIVVSRIDQLPDTFPSGGILPSRYWVVNNYGTNQTFTELDSIAFDQPGNISTDCSQLIQMYKRAFNADSLRWGIPRDSAEQLYMAPPSVVFKQGNRVTDFGQYFIANNHEAINKLTVMSKGDSGLNTLRHILACAQDQDTILFADQVDTILLQSPLMISKQVFLRDQTGQKVVLKMNLSEVGFSSAPAGILVSNAQVKMENIIIQHINNSDTYPALLNQGHLTMKNCTLIGNPKTIIKHSAGSSFYVEGEVEVK
jgi:photosystem II stability/assembly factor-like uncharacterized protein